MKERNVSKLAVLVFCVGVSVLLGGVLLAARIFRCLAERLLLYAHYAELKAVFGETVIYSMISGSLMVLGMGILLALLLHMLRRTSRIQREAEALCRKNQAMEELNRQTQRLAHHQRLEIMGTLRTVKRKMNPRLELFGVVLTMFDGRTNFSNQVAQEVRRHFPGKVFANVIPRNVRLAEAPSHGIPVMNYDKYSRGAKAYKELAEEFKNKL